MILLTKMEILEELTNLGLIDTSDLDFYLMDYELYCSQHDLKYLIQENHNLPLPLFHARLGMLPLW